MPLEIVLAAAALLVTIGACGAAVKFALDRDGAELAFLCLATGALALLAGPLIATVSLVGVRLASPGGAGPPDWHAALAPLYFWLLLAALVATAATAIALVKRLIRPWLAWREAARDPFADEFGRAHGADDIV